MKEDLGKRPICSRLKTFSNFSSETICLCSDLLAPESGIFHGVKLNLQNITDNKALHEVTSTTYGVTLSKSIEETYLPSHLPVGASTTERINFDI
jgi:hypothetical protein